MRFVCGGKVFRLTRSFARIGKKTELVCETDGEELSVEQGDLQMLLDGVTESIYRNTLYIGQQRAGTEESLAQALGNYMASYEETGDTALDVSGAAKCLKENRKELNARKRGTSGRRNSAEGRETKTTVCRNRASRGSH